VRRAVPLTLLPVLLLTLPLPAAAACVRDSEAANGRPAPPLRFGIGPLAQAGQVGAVPSPAIPERRARTNAALDRLRPPGRPFVLRLNRFFWSDREKGFRRYLSLTRRFARRGYLLELQVRYHPDPRQEGDIGAWRRHVREWSGASGASGGWSRCRSPTKSTSPCRPTPRTGPTAVPGALWSRG
jgi:hypothetical protein